MTKQEIDQIIQEEYFQGIIQEKEFYFSKGKEALNRWLDLQVPNELKEDIIRLSSDYTQFLEIAELDAGISKIKDLLFEIISYCDVRAKDKATYNQYEDNRTLADSSVRMGNWVDGLVRYKFKHSQISGTSILNAVNYLLFPQSNAPILSENMRKLISENLFKQPYNPNNFIHDLRAFFKKFDFKVENEDNYTFLASNLIYSFSDQWKHEVIGLMVSDGTGWHEGELTLDSQYSGMIVWNSKKPSGGAKILKFLSDKIKEGESFPIYVSSQNLVRYKITVIDYALNQSDLNSKNWDRQKIKYYEPNFKDYAGVKLKASIVFLAESIEKLTPIPVSEFEFYGKHKPPTQDNLQPIRKIPTIEVLNREKELMTMRNINTPLNQIFFGPPGTGKTYNTINQALQIAGVDINGLTRAKIKAAYDKKIASGQIVFTTFHQSMNYEEFVEGIKPNLSDDIDDESKTDLEYIIKPGIFKRISERAKNSLSSKDSFEDLWSEFYTHLISQGDVEFTSVTSELRLEPSESKEERIAVRFKRSYDPDALEGKKVFFVSKNTLKKLFDNQVDARANNARQEIRNFVGGGRATTYFAVYKSFYDFTEQKGRLFSKKQNYVIIIDEINRGNVSQIFGELITLIEKDKRLGESETLEVTLPYSNEKFGVPSNLYIIGTMNTADRSVEALDTALRRRFDFTEMAPKPELLSPKKMILRLWNKEKYKDVPWEHHGFRKEADALYDLLGINSSFEKEYYGGEDDLVEEWTMEDLDLISDELFKGVNLKTILTTINKRIGLLMDADHFIGHSYFMNIASWDMLMESMYGNVIPLLQEYFYGDYVKIGAILGSGFVRRDENNLKSPFASGYEDIEGANEVTYKIIDHRKDHPSSKGENGLAGFKKAINLLMNNKDN